MKWLNCLMVKVIIYLRPYSIVLYCIIYWVMVLHCIAFALQLCCLHDVSVCCLPFHINSTEHSIITQAASQWVLCFSGSLPIALIYLWLIIFLCYSRKINTMMVMTTGSRPGNGDERCTCMLQRATIIRAHLYLYLYLYLYLDVRMLDVVVTSDKSFWQLNHTPLFSFHLLTLRSRGSGSV